MTYLLSGLAEQTLVFSLVALAIYLSFRVLDFPDLTVDGSYATGAAVAAAGIAAGGSPEVFTLLAVVAGALAGSATAVIHTKIGINKIVSGLLVMIMLYSVNLVIMGRSNVSLLREPTVLRLAEALAIPSFLAAVALFGVVLIAAKVLLDRFLTTEQGTVLRALGDSEQFARSMGADTDRLKIEGLAIANGLVALAGALVAQNQGFSDVNMGFGVIIIGFASLVIGETLLRPKRVAAWTLAAIVGTALYYSIVTLALQIGLNPSLLKLITGLLVVVVLAIGANRKWNWRPHRMPAS